MSENLPNSEFPVCIVHRPFVVVLSDGTGQFAYYPSADAERDYKLKKAEQQP